MNTQLISKSLLLLNVGGSKRHFEWLSLRRCVVGGPWERLQRGLVIVQAPSGSRSSRDGGRGTPL